MIGPSLQLWERWTTAARWLTDVDGANPRAWVRVAWVAPPLLPCRHCRCGAQAACWLCDS